MHKQTVEVPEAGALIKIGFTKPEGGLGGYARNIAICSPDWNMGWGIRSRRFQGTIKIQSNHLLLSTRLRRAGEHGVR